jgi:hypothetical protein
VALSAARRDLLTDVNARYHELVVGWTTGAAEPDDAATELGVAEQADTSVRRVRTWPFDGSGIVTLFASAVIPLAQFVLTTAQSVLDLS